MSWPKTVSWPKTGAVTEAGHTEDLRGCQRVPSRTAQKSRVATKARDRIRGGEANHRQCGLACQPLFSTISPSLRFGYRQPGFDAAESQPRADFDLDFPIDFLVLNEGVVAAAQIAHRNFAPSDLECGMAA